MYGWAHSDARRFCPHPACSACPATLSHTFLECCAVTPVVAYIQRLWVAIDPAAPPLVPAVLLTADPRSWAPSPAFQQLWVRLRVSFLQAAWAGVQRARGLDGGGSAGLAASAAIAAAMLHACRTNMLQDWALATSGFRSPDADAPCTQLRGVCPKLSKERFLAKWGGQGVLCRQLRHDKLQILWSLRNPVAAL